MAFSSRGRAGLKAPTGIVIVARDRKVGWAAHGQEGGGGGGRGGREGRGEGGGGGGGGGRGGEPNTTLRSRATITIARWCFPAGATPELEKATQAWERYLSLKPKRPDTGVAALMVQAYGGLVTDSAGGSPLDVFRQAARTQKVIATERPSPISNYQLALIYYAIGDIAPGDKAADKSIASPPRTSATRSPLSSRMRASRE